MRSHGIVPRLLAFSCLAAGAALAAKASAALIIYHPPPTCPAPSLSVCQSESMHTDACSQMNENQCVPILQQAFETNVQSPATSGGSTTSITVPASLSSTGSSTVVTGAAFPYDERNIAFTAYDAEYESLMTQRRLPRTLGLGMLTRTSSSNNAPLDPASWEANGGAINAVNLVGTSSPCAEYAYEKYYDYERFQDAAATCLDNYECIYDVGAQTSVPGLDMPTLYKRDGSAMNVQVTSLPAVSQLKNAFFGTLPTTTPSPAPNAAPIPMYTDPGFILNALNWGGHGIPGDLMEALSTIDTNLGLYHQYSNPNRMAWHVQMHNAQASETLTPADFAAQDARMAAFQQLVAQYNAAAAVLPTTTINTAVRGVTQTKCSNGSSSSSGAGYPQPIPGASSSGSGSSSGGGVTCVTTTQPAPGLMGASATVQGVALEMAQAILAEWNHVNPHTGVVDHGCFDPVSVRCDWQPKMFANDYVGLFQAQRKADYDRCVSDTGDDLAIGANASLPVASASLASTGAFETYLTNLEAAYKAQTADIPWLNQPSDGTGTGVAGTMGVDAPGGNTLGDPNTFGAQYSYDSQWLMSFTQSNGTLCAGTGEIKASLNATATIFGQTATLANGLFQATDGPGGATIDSHLVLFGNDMYPEVNGTLGAGGWNVTPEGSTIQGPAIPSIPIVVFGFPIVLNAGVNLNYGVTGSASATTPNGCMPITSSGTFMQLQGTINPYVNATAYASASVDALVASLGIQTNLTLVQVNLPITGTLAMNYANSQPMVVVNVVPKLVFSELGGSVDAFASFLAWSASATIYSWSGTSQTVNLKGLTDSYSAGAINWWVNGHGG